MPPSEPLSPDEIEQRQSTVPEEDESDEVFDTDRPLTADEIEQRLEVGFDEDDQPVDDEG